MTDNQNTNVEYTANTQKHLKRSLKARHMNMIALGGAIGTGLFVAGGEVVSTAGPGGALVAYGLIGIMVYFLMTSLGEMATYLPIHWHLLRHSSMLKYLLTLRRWLKHSWKHLYLQIR